ncbi:MAG: 30S ribosomal protein S8 [Deltaproteobacteria bacterium]|jgi:small subunit ribosomal protein S8|nr:30S ribosomal protein S8 [Deltaproteobacteria bacterium]
MSDPIADLLTRVRNAAKAGHKSAEIPSTKVKQEILRIMQDDGYIGGFEVIKSENREVIKVRLRYMAGKRGAISNLKRVSKPSLRKYVGKEDIPNVLNGLGLAILSTSQGVMSGRKASELGIGGEVLCTVY